MGLRAVLRLGMQGLGGTLSVGISTTSALGLGAGRLLRVPLAVSGLVTVGDANCGVSAIAAVAPVLRARLHEVAIAVSPVFMLDAVAAWGVSALVKAAAEPRAAASY